MRDHELDELVRRALQVDRDSHEMNWDDVIRRSHRRGRDSRRRRIAWLWGHDVRLRWKVIAVAVVIVVVGVPLSVAAKGLLFDPEELDLNPTAPPTCTKVWSETEIASWIQGALEEGGYEIVRELPASFEIRKPYQSNQYIEPVMYVSATGTPVGPVEWDEPGVVTTEVGGATVGYTAVRLSWLSASGQIRIWVENDVDFAERDLRFLERFIVVTARSDPSSPC
jgi:hypothetical protein